MCDTSLGDMPSATNVSLPDGVSLQRVARVLLDAWEAGSHQWRDTPLQLREGHPAAPPPPAPQDALELFRLLHERQIPYLLVGGLAMLTYVQGRNTKGVSTLGRDPARGGVIAAARVVNEDDDVTIISTNGVVLRSRVANLPKGKRTSKESAVMTLKEGDAVASIARLEAKSGSSSKDAKDAKEPKQAVLPLDVEENKKAKSKSEK